MVRGCILHRIWLGPIINILLQTVIGVVYQFLVLEALNLADIPIFRVNTIELVVYAELWTSPLH
jgi:hypothetical protein